jgi:hypothetical protein
VYLNDNPFITLNGRNIIIFHQQLKNHENFQKINEFSFFRKKKSEHITQIIQNDFDIKCLNRKILLKNVFLSFVLINYVILLCSCKKETANTKIYYKLFKHLPTHHPEKTWNKIM